MQLRKLVLACGFASFALSNYASALGLGEVKLNSKLNQPLSAEIKLLEVQDLSAEQILIALASPADFERNSVDRLYFYTEFQFSVDLKHSGGPVVRITTRNPVREPYLNFLIEARWSAGRLLREYTVLMDLPTFDSAPPQAVQAPETAKPKVAAAKPRPAPPVSEPVAAAAPSEAIPEEAAEQERPKKKSKISSGTYGPIDGKDTLWEIAKEVRPDASVTVHQTMIALQRLNPDAFIRGNINLLKKGQVLRVPEVSDAAAVDRSEAVNQVANQNNKWSNNASADTDTDLGAQLDASRPTANNQPKSEPVSGRVKLEAPAGTETAEGGLGSGSDKAGGKGLEAKLSTSLEELDKAKSENTELTSRVHELEERLKTMQRLVDVSNEKMSALQLNAAKQAEVTAAVKSAAEAPVEAIAAPAEVPAADAAAASSAAPAAVPAAASSAAAKKKAPAKQKPPVEKTFVDHLSDNILWVALGAAGILGAGLVYIRRRREEDEEAGSFPEPQSFYIPEPAPGFESFNEPPQPQTDTQFVREEVIPEDEDSSGVAETDDVVSEAGIYITLGKYSQAEDMLLNALETNTASSGVYVKLLEVYSHTQNIVEFDKHYAALWPIGSPFELHRAAELRAAIADAGIFRASDNSLNEVVTNDFVPSAADAPVDENIDVTVRRYDLDFDKKAVAATTAGNILLGDQTPELDFNLDSKTHPDAEDLSDISLALDSMDEHKDEVIEEDIEVATLEYDAPGIDEEISFDFNELDADSTDFTTKDAAADLKFPGDEDFNLEMDVGDIDMAALDREMDHLDSDTAVIEPLDVASLDKDKDEDLAGFDALFDEPLTAEQEPPVTEEQSVKASELAATDIPEEPVELELGDELSLPEDDSELTTSVLDQEDIVANVSLESDAELEPLEYEALELPDDDELTLADDEAPAEVVAVDDDASLSELDKELESLDKGQPEAKTPLVEIDSDDDIDEEVFNLALSDFSAESLNAEAEAEDLAVEDADAELDFMVDADEAATKLDLARAYLDMGDSEGAREILAEVAQEGNEQQREEAVGLLSRIDV